MFTVRTGGAAELQVRRSRFVCTLARVGDEAEAAAFVAGLRRAHREAAHNCSAYVVGERGEFTRSSDDGEPAGTAGVPMLEVLTRRGLTGVAAVVTRYFGGVKLGAGGLVRAYGQVVAAAVQAVGIAELVPVVTVTVRLEHAPAGRFLGDLHARGLQPTEVRYGADVQVDVPVALERAAEFAAWAGEATAGRARLSEGARGYTEVPVTG
ncbi:IMPACT family protein [Actinomadura parmotrematis]|uniref:IMPACT family protein n=1 Tax=Actinomadura parmotrematis TaxID=2864039 RepID=A0ABS7FRF2_9ACTN|nr:YigZ family protein [Actinomadura parmotrematis]MBW8482550.1 IMPACT family protein [Actinomadura parmotrematis]